MSTKRRKPRAAEDRAMPYPSWSEIAAEVGASSTQSDLSAKPAAGKSWFDLLGNEGPTLPTTPKARGR